MRTTFLLRFSALFLAVCVYTNTASSQGQNQKLDDINLQVNFVNETIHGIMVANKLFELFNQDVNRFVDLESYQLQGFDNSDLPKSLFDDSAKDYYEVNSPKTYFDQITKSSTIYEENKVLAVQLFGVLRDIDKKRFDIEKYLDLNDLNDRENLPGIYGLLENCVTLYANYYDIYQAYSRKLNQQYKALPQGAYANADVIRLFREMHGYAVKTMHHIRRKNDPEAEKNLRSFGLMYTRFKKMPKGQFKGLDTNPNIYPKIETAIDKLRAFVEQKPTEKSYEQYGIHYYTHNKSAISKMNKYGNGFIQEMDIIIDDMNISTMKFLQIPHYFKVIYPKKLEIIQQIGSTQSFISTLPDRIRDRDIKKNKLVINTDRQIFELELFDHMVQDGDLVSLNFNGDWILENYSLEKRSKKLRLQLNPVGKNYLLLYAASVGKRPPNTMAVKYTNMQEEEVQIILKSDLKVSEIIDIIYEK